MSFLDTLKSLGLWQQQGAAQQPNPYGLDPAVMSQARMAALGNIGGQLLAMSQQMTPDQRARLMAQADWSGGYQGNLYNAAQMQLLGQNQKRKQMEDERTQAAVQWLQQKISGLPDGKQKQNAMIYLQLGDIQNAAAQLTAGAAEPKWQLVDGQVIDMNNPMAGAQPVPGLQPKVAQVDPKDRLPFINAYENAPEVQAFNTLAGTYDALSGAVYDNTKVSDLDFVYGVAKALDPTSVVRESEGQMVIDAQGLDAATIGRLNSMIGGGALLPQQRLELMALIKRRADAFRKLAETRRQSVLIAGDGVITDRNLRTLPLLPDIAPPEQVSAPGRRDLPGPLPEPELIGVQ
jgi:hypothetical protein